MASYDSKLITAKAQAEVLTVVKNAIDTVDAKATAAIPKVTTAVVSNVPAFNDEGALVDSGIKSTDIQLKISPTVNGNFVSSDENGFVTNSGYKPADFQKTDELLNSISAITNSEGIIALNGQDSAEARKILDSDVNSNEALYNAVRAFTNKNGSIVMPKNMGLINGETNKDIIVHNGSAILVGSESESVILKASSVDGKPQVYASTVEPDARIMTKGEIASYVTDRLTKNSDYRGIVTYIAVEPSVATAKGLIEALDASKFNLSTPPTALVFGDTEKEIHKGSFNGTNWTWQPITFGNGDWVYFAHIVSAAHPLMDAGRAVFKDTDDVTAFEILIDMTMVPDEVFLSVGADQKLTIARSSIKGGTVEAPTAFGAWNLKVDEKTTIQDALDDKITKLNILTNEPTSAATDDQLVSAKVFFNVFGSKDNLNTDSKDNHVAAINEVNTKSKNNTAEITALQASKLNKLQDVETVSLGNIITIKDKDGNIQDSGIQVAKITDLEANKITKVADATVGAIPTLAANGSLVNSSTKLDDVDKVIAEAVRVQDIITDADIAQLITDVFGA